jgi:threonine dehydrogenase-like Zn-dependent dehydrogenase
VTAEKMRGAVFADIGELAVMERDVPVIELQNEVILDVQACGICGTDLHILTDPPGQPATIGCVLGHEIVGVVSEAGEDVVSLRSGDRVVVAPNISCGQCVWCQRGLPNHCDHFTTIGIYQDGGLAPHVRVPAANCFPISPDVPSHIAALAEPLSTVVNGVRLAKPFPGQSAVVIGAGPAGLMYTALLRFAGVTVTVLEPSRERASLATEMGAAYTIDPTQQDPARTVHDLTDGLGADVVIDAVGSQLPVAMQVVRKAGRIVLFGLGPTKSDFAQENVTRNELTLVGAFIGQMVFPDAIRLLEQHAEDFAPLVTHRVGIEELPAAMEEMRAGRTGKVEIEFD